MVAHAPVPNCVAFLINLNIQTDAFALMLLFSKYMKVPLFSVSDRCRETLFSNEQFNLNYYFKLRLSYITYNI